MPLVCPRHCPPRLFLQRCHRGILMLLKTKKEGRNPLFVVLRSFEKRGGNAIEHPPAEQELPVGLPGGRCVLCVQVAVRPINCRDILPDFEADVVLCCCKQQKSKREKFSRLYLCIYFLLLILPFRLLLPSISIRRLGSVSTSDIISL